MNTETKRCIVGSLDGGRSNVGAINLIGNTIADNLSRARVLEEAGEGEEIIYADIGA